MKIALSAGELAADEPLGHALDIAQSSGADGIELWHPANTAPDIGRAIAAVRERDLCVACLATPTQLGTDARYERDRELLLDAVSIASRYGIPLVNTYFGYPSADGDDARIAVYRDRVMPVVELAEAAGVVITLENEFDCFGTDTARADITRRPAAVARLLQAVRSTAFRLTFDACNALFAHLDPSADFLAPLLPWIEYVHVKDGRRQSTGGGWRAVSDSGQAYETCAFGDGEVGWTSILAALDEHGFSGWHTIEPHADPPVRDMAWRRTVDLLRRPSPADPAPGRPGGQKGRSDAR